MKQNIIIIGFALLALSGVLYLAYDLHRESETEVLSQFHDRQLLLVRQLSHQIESYLRDRSYGLRTISRDPAVQYHDIPGIDEDIQFIFKVYLQKQLVKGVSVYDENGIIIYSTNDSALGRNYSNCEFFDWAKQAENKGKVFITNLIRATGQENTPPYFRFLLVTPVYQDDVDSLYPKPNKKFVGVISMTIDCGELIRRQLEILNPKTEGYHVWVIDKDGTLMFQSEHPEMVLRNIHQSNEQCYQCHTSFDYVKRILTEKQGALDYELKNHPKKLASYAQMNFQNASWIVVLNTPYGEVTGFIQKEFIQMILLMSLVVLAIGVSSILMYRNYRLKVRAEEEARQWREKRELEERVIQSEEQYRMIVESAHDMIWTLDINGNYTYINTQGKGIDNYDVSGLIGKSFTPFIVPDDLPNVMQVFKNTLSGKKHSYEVRVYSRDSEIHLLSVNTVPLYKNKNIIGTVSFGRDITENRRAEDAMKESEAKFKVIFETAIDGILIVDIELTKFFLCNENICRMLGYEKDELLSLGVKDIHPEKDLPYVLQQIDKQIRKEISLATNIQVKRKDGTVFYADINSIPISINKKKYLMGTFRDITERKRAQEALHESEAKYRTMVETSHDIIWMLDKEGKFVFINRSAEEISGYSINDWLGKSFAPLIPPGDMERMMSIFHEILRGNPMNYEANVVRKDGSIFSLAINTTPMYSGEEIIGAISFGQNITERKRSEEILRQSEERLNTFINSATDAFTIWDSELNLLDLNQSALSYAPKGIKKKDLIGKNIQVLEPDVKESGRLEPFLEVIKTGKPFSSDELVLHLPFDNEVSDRYLNVRAFKVGNGLGIMTTDITERKRAELTSKESEGKYRTLIDNIQDGVFIIQDAKMQFVNEAFAKMVGYTVEEVSGMDFQKLVAPEDLKLVADRYRRRQAGEDVPREYEFRTLHKDGTTRIIVNMNVGLIMYQGKVASMGTVKDITERKRAEEVVRESETRYRTLVESSPDIVFVTDYTGKMLYANPTLEKQTGFTADDFQFPQEENPFIHPDDAERVGNFIADFAKNDKEYSEVIENRFLDKMGRTHWYSSVISKTEYQGERALQFITHDITERMQAEETLQQLQRQNKLILDSVGDGIYGVDLQGYATFINPAAARMFGWKVEELLGKPMHAIMHHTKGDGTPYHRDECLIYAAFKDGAIHQVDNEIFWRKDGTSFPVDYVSTPIRDERGEVLGAVVVFNDITERKQAEETLRETRDYLDNLLNYANAPIIVWDPEFRITRFNHAFERLTGYRSEDVIGKELDFLFPSDTRRESIRFLYRTTKGERWETVEIPILHKDGTVRNVLWNSATLFSPDDKTVIATIAQGHDITARKKAEIELKQSELQYRMFFENDLTGDYIASPDGRLLSCNPAFVRIFGFKSIEEALQTNVKTFFPLPKQREELLHKIRVQKKLEYYEIELLRRDGKIVYLIANIYGKFDSDGNLTETLGYLFDDTKHRELEEQLLQAQKLESLGTLAGGIAHDFNNILSIVIGHAGLLEKVRTEPTKHAQGVAAIKKASQRATTLVKQLLTFARKTEVVLESVLVNDTIDEITKMLSETFPKTITISTNLHPELPSITADANQLHQVFLNLCVNARDAMPDGGTLCISTRTIENKEIINKFSKATAARYVEIDVSDTGMGMDETIRSRIFEPFFTTKGPGRGTGLGLTVIYGIVENHHGFIDVESEVGKGTTFHIMFPVPERFIERVESQQEISEEFSGGTETLLLVEDEEGIRELTRDFLVVKGYSVLMAADGEEAIDIYLRQQNEIAVVISDIGLPKFNGIELFKKLKVINPTVKVIFASGYIDPHTRSEMREAGAKYFVQKPYLPHEVLTKIREAIDSERDKLC
ncbi:MAG: PAS domain S-box protein [Ignavibacteriae bacterium]|nr:PAS domain S-box protein [Ignavibacteriota bacterium]